MKQIQNSLDYIIAEEEERKQILLRIRVLVHKHENDGLETPEALQLQHLELQWNGGLLSRSIF